MSVMRQRIILWLFLLATALPMAAQKSAGGDNSGSGCQECGNVYLRANLLRWATLTPDVGLEWRINRNVGILVNGSWTTWSWNDKDRRYALREIMPEVRWYLGKERRGYVGAMYKAGAFNYKFSELGKQGNINGCGVTGGYVLPLNKCLSLDFSLALGYLHASYDTYRVIESVRVRDNHHTKSWFGPINAGVTLSWKIY